MTTKSFALALGLLPALAVAQDSNAIVAAFGAQVQRLIHQEGHRCDAVAAARSGPRISGATDGFDFVMIFACQGGEEHAIKVNTDGELPRFLYYMSCRNILNPMC